MLVTMAVLLAGDDTPSVDEGVVTKDDNRVGMVIKEEIRVDVVIVDEIRVGVVIKDDIRVGVVTKDDIKVDMGTKDDIRVGVVTEDDMTVLGGVSCMEDVINNCEDTECVRVGVVTGYVAVVTVRVITSVL